VTIENFLHFWNHYNTTIIEGLIALIVVLSLFLGFRHFFVKETQSELSGSAGSGDIAQIEQTLKKILENQANAPSSASSASSSDNASGASAATSASALDSGGELMFSASEVQGFRNSLDEALAKNEELQKKISNLEQAGAAVAAAGSAAADAKEKAQSGDPLLEAELRKKVLDLEARLKEYELISDDIAELSKYREENRKLKAELTQARGASQPVNSTEVPAGSATPEKKIENEVPISEVKEPSPSRASETAASSTSNLADEANTSPNLADSLMGDAPAEEPEVETQPPNPLDEEFLKEFAEVVHGKKPENAQSESQPTTPRTEGGAGVTEEAQKLMDSFESFVANKKE
jgi:hypothetical protein